MGRRCGAGDRKRSRGAWQCGAAAPGPISGAHSGAAAGAVVSGSGRGAPMRVLAGDRIPPEWRRHRAASALLVGAGVGTSLILVGRPLWPPAYAPLRTEDAHKGAPLQIQTPS